MSIKKSMKFIGTTVLVAASTGLFLQPAFANERRAHSSSCTYYNDAAGTTLYNGAYISVGSTARTIFCPVNTDSYLAHYQATALNVHGYEASGSSNYSRACVKHYNSSGTSCGTTNYWGATYAGGAAVNLSSWTTYGASFPYILNYIDASGQLYGYWFAN